MRAVGIRSPGTSAHSNIRKSNKLEAIDKPGTSPAMMLLHLPVPARQRLPVFQTVARPTID